MRPVNIPTCSEAQFLEDQALTAEYAPVPPAGWRDLDPFPVGHPLRGLLAYQRKGDQLTVLFSAARYDDGRVWVHVSMSRKSRMPTYDDMVEVKRLFIGADKKAIQIFAPESEHVNIHEYCLHLFWTPDGDGLPNFAKGGTI